jgi:hypothetical protein
VNNAKSSFLRGFISRVFSRAVPVDGYVFNFRGRWRYESHVQRRAHRVDPLRGMWSGEVLAYGWLARQAQERARAKQNAHKPDAQILALTRS